MQRQFSKAFTLLELLVVVAIIAVLAGLILPALARGKKLARAAQCASNERQIALACQLYADTHDGVSVPGRMARFGVNSDPRNLYEVGNGQHFRPRWFVTLGSASKVCAFNTPSTDPAEDNLKLVDNKLFLCPSAPERVNNRDLGYGYNFTFLGNSRLRASGSFIQFPVRVDTLAASRTVLVADSLGTAAGKPAAARTPYDPDGSVDRSRLGYHAWALDPPRLIPGVSDFCDDANRVPQHRGGVDARHDIYANTVFLDGHVEKLKPEKLGYVVNPDGSFGVSAPASNAQFSGTGQDSDPPPIL
ncbi:MAG: prepilin-type N-terminal cleavage/methylation domain-containing protein [Verrucomicrobia bacterium]|nr:prepilin-type N-terminal cleavage/methylation domain-containing protein [Verrucomicrobiota bacterium]